MALIIVDFRIIFLQKQGQAAFILFPLHDKHKIRVHQIVGSISQSIQNHINIRLFIDHRIIVLVQNNLTDLPAGKI